MTKNYFTPLPTSVIQLLAMVTASSFRAITDFDDYPTCKSDCPMIGKFNQLDIIVDGDEIAAVDPNTGDFFSTVVIPHTSEVFFN